MAAEMNPKKQECLGFYLYGAGYYSRDDNTLGMVTGNGSQQPHFCLGCPKLQECENLHEERVRQLAPGRVEVFEVRMKQALRRGFGATMAAAYLAKQGLDPFADAAVENFSKGHADRGRKDGTLVR